MPVPYCPPIVRLVGAGSVIEDILTTRLANVRSLVDANGHSQTLLIVVEERAWARGRIEVYLRGEADMTFPLQ